jgi:demethylmenaquinone methyltransferase / 2-methoxy-6-polyprenyl-1,4-benzoquinol methylase
MNPVVPHRTLEHIYGDDAHREGYVRQLFDDTAPWYDWGVRFLSFGSGDWYRREAVKRVGLVPGMKLLDLASGTGVVARAAAEVTGEPGAIVACDVSYGMLHAGRAGSPRVQTPAENLPFSSAVFDRVTIGFAMRHFADLVVVFRECFRTLRPGGRLLILEITAPAAPIPRALLGAYMGYVVPTLARILTRQPRTTDLFRYYWETTRDCVRPAVILDAMREAGFTDTARHVELGIFSEYSGVK